MTYTRQILVDTLASYTTSSAEEKNFVQQFLDLLTHDRAFHRDHLPGHITGSAFITDTSRSSILLTHHAKLDKWLQPGGHADGDEDILGVALREAEEETGLKKFKLLDKYIFDLDIHTIPARKDFPEHLHYDVRFLFEADQQEKLLITEESIDLKWFPIQEVSAYTSNASIDRMLKKL